MRILKRSFPMIIFILTGMIFMITGCGPGGGGGNPTPTSRQTPTPSATTTATPTPTSRQTPTPSAITTATPTPTPPRSIAGKLIFLHHSTGGGLWSNGDVAGWFTQYNTDHGTNYEVTEDWYDRDGNYPYDFWYDWCDQNNLGALAAQYQVIVWKHCFPVSEIEESSGPGDITSAQQTIPNYQLQYNALKAKMHAFPSNQFIVWTGAVHAQGAIDAGQAQRTKDFFDWVRNTWDEEGDNIFLWDFYHWETDDNTATASLYLKYEYSSEGDSHPNTAFNQRVAPYFCNRIIDVFQGNGDSTSIRGD